MTTETAPMPEPENGGDEPFQLSDSDVEALSRATGVRPDIIRVTRGESYEDVRVNAVKLHDYAPGVRVHNPVPHRPSVIGPEEDVSGHSAEIMRAIRRRLGVRCD